MENSPPPKASLAFYRNIALVFLLIGAAFAWAAFRWHEWFYGIFAAITLLNAFMSTLKYLVMREVGR